MSNIRLGNWVFIGFNTAYLIHGFIFNECTWFDWFNPTNSFAYLSFNVVRFWYSILMTVRIVSSPLLLVFICVCYVDFSRLCFGLLYKLYKPVWFIYIGVSCSSFLQFCTHDCFNSNSCFCWGGCICDSLLFSEDNIWGRSPMVPLFSLVSTKTFQDIIFWSLYQRDAFQRVYNAVRFVSFK